MRWGRTNVARLILAAAVCLGAAAAGWAQAPVVEAKAAVLMDRASGTVLYSKAMHERRPVASTTKIMTALVTLESADLSDMVVIGKDATDVAFPGLDLVPGERMALGDLLTALLLKSSNAAAVAIADHVAGSVPAFCRQMNERARALGANDTNFVNPHGLYAPQHYSSAYDLALITREALAVPYFRELVARQTAEIERPDATGTQVITNHNKLVARVDYVDGVKTGYVSQAGQCLVASGTRNDWQLMSVVLDSPDHYGEALALLEFGFSTYRRRVFAQRGDAVGTAGVRFGRQNRVPAVCDQDLTQVIGPGLPEEGRLEVSLEMVSAPVAFGDAVGEARLVVADKVAASSPLLAGTSVPRSRLIVTAIWMLPVAALLAAAAVGVRTGAKLVKGRRRRRSGLPPEGGGTDPRRPRPD